MRLSGIGFELTAVRRVAKLTQAEVAERMGTTQSAVSRVESGGATPSLHFLDRYALAVGTTLTLEVGGARPELASRVERAERVKRVLGGYVFDPWSRDPAPAEQRSLEADGLTRERFESQASAR